MPKETFECSGRTYAYEMRRSKRAKNLLIHVHVDGRVEVVVPRNASYSYARDFVHERRGWICEKLLRASLTYAAVTPLVFETGNSVPCFGDSYELDVIMEEERKRSYVCDRGGMIYVRARDAASVRAAMMRWYRQESYSYFLGQSQEYAHRLGVDVSGVRIGDQKTQWGSCHTAKKELSYNMRLARGPEEVARYVAAHEVAHLLFPNHSKRYWRCVASLDPFYEKHRSWLRTHGHTLVL